MDILVTKNPKKMQVKWPNFARISFCHSPEWFREYKWY